MFFRQHLDRAKVLGQAGALKFIALLRCIAFGDQNATVAGGQFRQCLYYAIEQFDLVLRDYIRESDNLCVRLRRDDLTRKLLETRDKRSTEALEPIAMLGDCGPLTAVQVLPHFLR